MSLPPARRLVLAIAWVGCVSCSCDRPGGPPSAPPSPVPTALTSTPPAAAPTGAPLAPSTSSAAAASPERRLVIHLVPLGDVPAGTLEQTVLGLRNHAPVDPIVEPPRTPPARAKSPRRGAWQAGVLLDWLDNLPRERGGKVMGVTEAEIVTRKGNVPIWGILGMGSLDGRCSVISTYRMRRRWENGGAPEAVVRDRLWKIAIHELGHTLGLDHCPTEGCIMEDGQGTVKTVDRDTSLCEQCARRFSESLRRNAQ